MNCGPAAKKVTPEEHAGDFRRALELSDKLTQENIDLREKVKMLIMDRDMWRKAALEGYPKD